MKKVFTILLAAITALCLAACQETPDKVVVVKKDTERLVEQVRENSSEEEQDAAAVNTLAEKLGVPDRFFAENVYSDTFSMKADAEIVLPAAEKLPTVRVIPADFSQNTVDRLYDYLVGDTVMYEMSPLRTKADIEADLIDWKKTLSDPAASSEQKAQAMDTNGKYFEVHQNNTGGEIIKTENVGGFSVVDTASRGARFYYTNTALLESALGGTGGRTFEVGEITQEEWENAGYEFTGISPDEAVQEVDQLLEAIGADDMAVATVEMSLQTTYDASYNIDDNSFETYQTQQEEILSGKHNDKITGITYRVYCERQVNGVNVTSDTFSSYLDDAYGKQWYYEDFTVDVCKDGIYSVRWASPYEVTETIAQDTEILPFSEAEKIINQMFRANHDPGPESTALFEYEVDQIVLSLRRIAEPGGVESGLLIPVWDVYGEAWITYPGEPKMSGNGDVSLLTINAIDGSVIDLDRGY